MSNKISNTEIETRGPLPSKTFVPKIISKIRKQGKTTVKKNRQVIIFYKENNKGFRVKWDKNKKYFEFVYKTKKGTQRTVRDEFAITISKKQIDNFFKILDELGLKKGFLSPTHRIDITTPFIIWSFKLGSVIGDYWEAEANNKLVQEFNRNTDKIRAYLEDKARSLGLSFWSDEEFKQVKQEKWNEIKPLVNSKIMKILQNDKY